MRELYVEVERDGYKWLWLGGDDHLGSDGHEANLEFLIRGLLGEDRVFLDVGAHVGHWAVRLAGQARKVLAIEANPKTAEVLRRNLELNCIDNVAVYEVAAWDAEELLRLEDPNGIERGGSTRVLPGGDQARGVPLDAVLDPDQEIHLVKMDVEGADLHALRGMAGTLSRCRPVMFIERHDQYGYYALDELHAVLDELGYDYVDEFARYMDAFYMLARPTG